MNSFLLPRPRRPSASRLRLAGVAALAVACAGPALAQRPSMRPADGGGPRLSASVTPVHQAEADLDGGGRFSVNRLLLRGAYDTALDNGVGLGVSISFDVEEYDFGGRTALADRDPWHNLYFADLSLPVAWTTHETLSWRIAPTVGVAGEDGASWDESIVYGAVVSVGRMFRPGLVLGIGGGIFRDVEETDGFPFVMVRWTFADRWTLANPFRPGPAGPAGLELARDLGNNWDVGIGGAYRNYRFRLADDGAVPGGVGEAQGVPLYLRLSKAWNERSSLDLWAGAVVGGKLELEDEDGNRVARDDHDPAPLIALTLSLRY